VEPPLTAMHNYKYKFQYHWYLYLRNESVLQVCYILLSSVCFYSQDAEEERYTLLKALAALRWVTAPVGLSDDPLSFSFVTAVTWLRRRLNIASDRQPSRQPRSARENIAKYDCIWERARRRSTPANQRGPALMNLHVSTHDILSRRQTEEYYICRPVNIRPRNLCYSHM